MPGSAAIQQGQGQDHGQGWNFSILHIGQASRYRTRAAAAVHLAILRLADFTDRRTRPTYHRLGELTGLSGKSVKRALIELEAAELIDLEAGHGSAGITATRGSGPIVKIPHGLTDSGKLAEIRRLATVKTYLAILQFSSMASGYNACKTWRGTLAATAGITERSASRAIRELVELGLIRRYQSHPRRPVVLIPYAIGNRQSGHSGPGKVDTAVPAIGHRDIDVETGQGNQADPIGQADRCPVFSSSEGPEGKQPATAADLFTTICELMAHDPATVQGRARWRIAAVTRDLKAAGATIQGIKQTFDRCQAEGHENFGPENLRKWHGQFSQDQDQVIDEPDQDHQEQQDTDPVKDRLLAEGIDQQAADHLAGKVTADELDNVIQSVNHREQTHGKLNSRAGYIRSQIENGRFDLAAGLVKQQAANLRIAKMTEHEQQQRAERMADDERTIHRLADELEQFTATWSAIDEQRQRELIDQARNRMPNFARRIAGSDPIESKLLRSHIVPLITDQQAIDQDSGPNLRLHISQVPGDSALDSPGIFQTAG